MSQTLECAFKQVFITLLSFSRTKACIARPTFLNLNPDEHNQELLHYLFMVKLDKCNGSCITFNDLSSRICVLNKAEYVNLNVFNMITGMNESKTSMKHFM